MFPKKTGIYVVNTLSVSKLMQINTGKLKRIRHY